MKTSAVRVIQGIKTSLRWSRIETWIRSLSNFLLHSVKVIKLHSLWNGTDFSKSFIQPLWPHRLEQYIPSKIFSASTGQSCVSSIAIQKYFVRNSVVYWLLAIIWPPLPRLYARSFLSGVINGPSMFQHERSRRDVTTRLQAVFKARLQAVFNRLQAVFKTLRRR